MIKAQAAWKFSAQGLIEKRDRQRAQIEDEILKAGKRGDMSIYYNQYIDDILLEDLRLSGYKVKRVYTDWGTGVDISWKDARGEIKC